MFLFLSPIRIKFPRKKILNNCNTLAIKIFNTYIDLQKNFCLAQYPGMALEQFRTVNYKNKYLKNFTSISRQQFSPTTFPNFQCSRAS